MSGESAELDLIFKDIYDKTGTEVRLKPLGGEETEFSVEYCGEKYSAYVAGKGEQAEKTAKLVSYLVESADPQFLPDKSAYLKNILLGEGNRRYIYRFMTKYNVQDAPCYALDVMVDRRISEAFSHIESCLAETNDLVVMMDDTRLAVAVFRDETQLPVELGSFLVQSLYEELGVKANVGIGCEVKSFTEIAESYLQAATAMRMSGLLRSKGEVHTYREYLLIKMLEDLPESKRKEYMEQFHITGAKEVFSDEDMIGTAEEFLENSLNLSETSRNLYMHRNTLMYRLDKIERLTGLNIRKFSDAVTFRVITILYKLLQ